MHKIYSFAILIAFISLISCKEDPKTVPSPIEIEDEWPTFVDTGANIVAYKVDGKIRVTKNISKLDSNKGFLSCGYLLHEEPKQFYFIGNRISDESFDGVQIVIDNLKDIGSYKLSNVNNQLVGAYMFGTNEFNAKQYTTNDLDTGFVLVTNIDTIKGVITGRFEFNSRYVFGSERKKITEGRFDLKYYR